MQRPPAAAEEESPPPAPGWSGVRRWGLALVLAVGFGGYFLLDLDRVVSVEALARNRDGLEAWVDANPLLSRAVYAGLYFLAIAFSLPVGVLLTVAGAWCSA